MLCRRGWRGEIGRVRQFRHRQHHNNRADTKPCYEHILLLRNTAGRRRRLVVVSPSGGCISPDAPTTTGCRKLISPPRGQRIENRIHAAPPRCMRSKAISTEGQWKRQRLPATLIVGILPARRHANQVLRETGTRRRHSASSMNTSFV